MIFFTCNYCNELTLIPIGDNAGKVLKVQCSKCKKYCFLYLSRIDAKSWKEEDVVVDEENKKIEIKDRK